MNIASRAQRCFAAYLLLFGFAASVSQAQTVNVNGAACAAATVTFGNGSININTGGCGTTVITTPPPPPPSPSQPPSISSLSVASGTPNAPVTIFGTNLGGATVMIGGVMANAGNNSGMQIITNVPSNANLGVGTVAVTTSIGTSSAPFIVNAAPPPAIPSISSLAPNTGTVGTIVTIAGTGLTGATVTIGGVAATITTSSANSITTSVPAGVPASAAPVVVTTGAGTSSSTFTVIAVVAGESSIEGYALPTPSKLGFVVPPIRPGANGAGSDVNAYAMPPSRCSTTPALTRSWQHNIDLSDYKGKNAFDYFSMGANEALSYKFTVPTADTSGGFIYNDGANAVVRPTFISVTSAPCDFNTTKIESANRDACFQTGINGNSLNWVNITGPIPAAYCRLVKGQTYYMNIRFQDARPSSQGGTPTSDSCISGNCGGILQVL